MNKILITTLVVAAVASLSACGKKEEVVITPQSSSQQAPDMAQQVAAIKSCMDQGLSEETCASVHKQMVTGTLTGAPSMSACEAQYGVGKCGNVPVAHSDGTSGSIFLPLIAGAALGYLAHHLMSSRSMPAGATVPQKSWLNNRPAIYQQAVTQNRQATGSIIGKDLKPVPSQASNYAVKPAYTEKSATLNGKPLASAGKPPTPYVVPGAVTPVQKAPQAPAKVEYKQPTTGYAAAQKPAQVSQPPKVTYSPPATTSKTTSSSTRSGKR